MSKKMNPEAWLAAERQKEGERRSKIKKDVEAGIATLGDTLDKSGKADVRVASLELAKKIEGNPKLMEELGISPGESLEFFIPGEHSEPSARENKISLELAMQDIIETGKHIKIKGNSSAKEKAA